MFQEMHAITVVVSANCSLVGVRRSEPSAVEHGLPLLVALHVLLEVVPHGHHEVLEAQPLLVESVAQDS
jgi:hypothetical protein